MPMASCDEPYILRDQSATSLRKCAIRRNNHRSHRRRVVVNRRLITD